MRSSTGIGALAPLLVVFLAGCDDGPAAPAGDGLHLDLAAPWVASSPAQEGFDLALLADAVSRAEELDNLRALLVVRNGRLVTERYLRGTDRNTPLDVRSVTKTVTGLLVGMAADRNALDAEDPISRWLDAEDGLRPAHDAIRLRHLLTMTSGIEWSDAEHFVPWIQSGRPVGYVLDLPVVADPDTRFIYNTGGSHLLAVAVDSAMPGGLMSLAVDGLFRPLGMEDWRWPTLDGVPVGGAGLALRARDLAKLGQLLLQEGRSGSTALVSPGWMEATVSPRVSVGTVGPVLRNGGYGYQLWTESDAPEALVAWGYGGQFIWVIPERRLVLVAAHHWSGIGDDGSARQSAAVAEVLHQVVAAAR